jgi:tetratricopeptide (TPR) repeat protein
MIFFSQAFNGYKSVMTAFFLLLFLIQGSLFGQVADQTVYTHTQKFRFDANARQGSALAVNELLQILSEGSGKLRVFTGYTIEADMLLAYKSSENNGWAISLEVEKFTLSGDLSYRHFSLEKKLLPPYLDLLLQVKTDEGKVHTELKLENISWQDQSLSEIIHMFSPKNGRLKSVITIDVKSASFHYGDAFDKEVIQLGNALQSYYQAGSDMHTVDSLLSGLDAYAFESVILDEFRLCEAEILLNRIIHSDFLQILTLDKTDPLGIVKAISLLKQQVSQLRDDFNNVISHIDRHFYQKGIELLASDSVRAREFFERAVVYNPLHFPSQIELGRMDIVSGEPYLAMERFSKFLSVIHPPSSFNDETEMFIQFLFDSEIENVDKAIEDGRFLDALRQLSEVEKFCNSVLFWECPRLLYEKIAEVHYGMYRSYLSVANRAYTSANYSFAVNYIKSALEYKQNNSNYISDDSEAMQLLQKVLDGYYSLARMALVQNNFSGATDHLKSAEKICETWTNLRCQADAAEMVQRVQLMQQAAARVAVEVTINEPQIRLPQLSMAEAGSKVRDLLSKGHLKAWAGDVAGAKDILNDLLPYTIRYELRKDSLINARMVSLADLIVIKECELAQRDIQATINITLDYFRRGYYHEAKTSYDQAIMIHAEAPAACSWNFTDSLKALNYINTVANYNTLMHNAQTAYFNAGQRGFDLFISKYKTAGNFFVDHKLESLGVKHQSLYDFTVISSNSALIKVVIVYMADGGQHEEAFKLIQLLKKMGFDARQLRSLLEQAGKKAALSVYDSNPELKPSVFLEEKTEGDQWYRSYTKSFIKNWPG